MPSADSLLLLPPSAGRWQRTVALVSVGVRPHDHGDHTGQAVGHTRASDRHPVGQHARPADGAQNIDDSGVRDRNDIAGLKNNIVGGVAAN